jgi:hypothetical protein
MNIPWKIKSAIFRIIDVLGIQLLVDVLQKYVTKRSVQKSTTYNPNWELHLNVINKFGPMTKLFEFGAGQSLAQNLFLSHAIDEQELVDLNFILDLELVEKSRRFLDENYCSLAHPINSRDDLLEYGIKYTAPVDAKGTHLESASMDICVSTDTLEHIPMNEIKEILQEIHRVLKLGGILSVKIDYSDHYSHTDETISSLNFLRYSDTEWMKHNHSYHYQNRLRHLEYKQLILSSGFEMLDERVLNVENSFDGTNMDKTFSTRKDTSILEGYFCAIKVNELRN